MKPDLYDVVGWLRASLHPGTPLPWRNSILSDDRRAELDHHARLEMHDRSDIAPGAHPAPMRLEILDLLDEAAGLADGDEHAFIRRAMAVLGLTLDGQLLDALCPWCEGRTARHPVGGARTLRVRIVPDRRDPQQAVPVVICEGDNCSPSDASAAYDERWHGHPTWPQHEWEWLAAQIDAADRLRGLSEQQIAHQTEAEVDFSEEKFGSDCRCGTPVKLTGKRGRPAKFCSDDCRRAADAERKRSAA